MKSLYSLLVVALCLVFAGKVTAQTTIYFEDFGRLQAVPTGWNLQTPGWFVDSSTTASNNSPIPTYSGGYHIILRNRDTTEPLSPPVGTYSFTTKVIDATNYANILISWAARRSNNFAAAQTLKVEASATGQAGPWTALNLVDRPANGNWDKILDIALPTAFDHASALCFRVTATTVRSSGTYRLDDLTVDGDLSVGLGDGLKSTVPIWRQQASEVGVTFENNGTATLSIIDLVGHVHHTATIKGNEATLDLSALPRGIYYFHLQQGSSRVVRKIALR
jgi:hypothetical protein